MLTKHSELEMFLETLLGTPTNLVENVTWTWGYVFSISGIGLTLDGRRYYYPQTCDQVLDLINKELSKLASLEWKFELLVPRPDCAQLKISNSNNIAVWPVTGNLGIRINEALTWIIKQEKLVKEVKQVINEIKEEYNEQEKIKVTHEQIKPPDKWTEILVEDGKQSYIRWQHIEHTEEYVTINFHDKICKISLHLNYCPVWLPKLYDRLKQVHIKYNYKSEF